MHTPSHRGPVLKTPKWGISYAHVTNLAAVLNPPHPLHGVRNRCLSSDKMAKVGVVGCRKCYCHNVKSLDWVFFDRSFTKWFVVVYGVVDGGVGIYE